MAAACGTSNLRRRTRRQNTCICKPIRVTVVSSIFRDEDEQRLTGVREGVNHNALWSTLKVVVYPVFVQRFETTMYSTALQLFHPQQFSGRRDDPISKPWRRSLSLQKLKYTSINNTSNTSTRVSTLKRLVRIWVCRILWEHSWWDYKTKVFSFWNTARLYMSVWPLTIYALYSFRA